MRWSNLGIALGACCLLVVGLSSGQQPSTQTEARAAGWQSTLARRVEAYGHRNWIVIADAAYPVQTSLGIETIVTGADHLEVVRTVFHEMSKARHIRPVVYLDAELGHIQERQALGIKRYRDDLALVLGNRRIRSLPHEEIIDRLDKAGEKFKVLILKTNLTLPYTSVFLELDCGYWSPEAEEALREAMKRSGE